MTNGEYRLPRLTRRVLVSSLLLQAVAAYPASSADLPPRRAVPDESVENIVVTGQRPEALRQFMLDFIVEIGDPATRSRGYARWQDRVCAGVYNVPDQDAAQYIVDKISLVALDTGLRTGAPGCRPNLHIVFSPDARELAARMVEESPQTFRPFGNAEATTQGAAALERFKSSDAPVRWWQVTMVVDETGQPAIELPGLGVPIVRSIASRINSTVSDAIWGCVVIVDVGKLDKVKWPQLADYLAMVSLAQVKPDARPAGYDSILNLFSVETPPAGMTEMDRVYLRALYQMDTMMLPHSQRGVFSSSMVRVQRQMEEYGQ